MTFYIKHTDGTSLVTLQDGTIDNTTTNLTLVGKNFPTYGQYVNQNFVSLLENSAGTTAPPSPLLGQMWYDSANKNINFYRAGSVDNSWQKVAMTSEGTTPPNDARLGDLWFDTENKQLKVFDTSLNGWRLIGPQTTNNGKLTVTGNNSFQLIIGGNTFFTVDNLGGVNVPYGPCVWGQGVDTTTMTVASRYITSGITSFSTWVPNRSGFIDKGSNFSFGTSGSPDGRFTVKTSGIYEVYAHVTTVVGTSAGQIRLSWYKNDASINLSATTTEYGGSQISQTRQLVCAGFINASYGDTIKLVYATEVDATLGILPNDSSYRIRLVQ